jgi:hypothetical protein
MVENVLAEEETPVISKPKRVRKPFKFKVGDRVRISHLRNIFTREYDEKWSGEIFVVSERRLRGRLPIYRLKDYLEDEIKGTFYHANSKKWMFVMMMNSKWKQF